MKYEIIKNGKTIATINTEDADILNQLKTLKYDLHRPSSELENSDYMVTLLSQEILSLLPDLTLKSPEELVRVEIEGLPVIPPSSSGLLIEQVFRIHAPFIDFQALENFYLEVYFKVCKEPLNVKLEKFEELGVLKRNPDSNDPSIVIVTSPYTCIIKAVIHSLIESNAPLKSWLILGSRKLSVFSTLLY